MNNELNNLINSIRDIATQKGIEEISLTKLYDNPVIPNDLLDKYFDRNLDMIQLGFRIYPFFSRY